MARYGAARRGAFGCGVVGISPSGLRKYGSYVYHISPMPDPLEVLRSGVMSEDQWLEISACPRVVEELEGRTEVSPKLIERMVRVARETKRRAGKPTPHFAKYCDGVVRVVSERIPDGSRVLDPMAGTMERLRELERPEFGGHQVHGIELEPEWVNDYRHPRLIQGDARSMPYEGEFFDVVVCSPSFGNRMADRTGTWWDSVDRRTYASALGRNVSAGSACVQFTSPDYARLHLAIWAESVRVLKTGGLVFLNLKDHVRGGKVVPVTTLHRRLMSSLAMVEIGDTAVPAKGLPAGANHDVRAESVEKIITWRKPPESHDRAARLKEELNQ